MSGRGKAKPEPFDANERMGGHIKELTAIHAHLDALALAVEAGAAFRDNEIEAILFDLEERLMRVRDGLQDLPSFNNGGEVPDELQGKSESDAPTVQ